MQKEIQSYKQILKSGVLTLSLLSVSIMPPAQAAMYSGQKTFDDLSKSELLGLPADKKSPTPNHGLASWQSDTGGDHRAIEKSVVGSYKVAGNYLSFILLPNRRYMMVGYGAMVAGEWRVVDGNRVQLLPLEPEYPFAAFGRVNKALGKQTRMTVDGDKREHRVLMHDGQISSTAPRMTVLTHSDDDKLYKYTHTSKIKQLSLAQVAEVDPSDSLKTAVYHFDTAQFNELFIRDYATVVGGVGFEFTMDKANDTLIWESDALKKAPLSEMSEDDLTQMYELSYMQFAPKTVHYSAEGKLFPADEWASDNHSFDSEDYFFDTSLNAYVRKDSCTQACDPATLDDDDVFYRYQLLPPTVSYHKVKVSE